MFQKIIIILALCLLSFLGLILVKTILKYKTKTFTPIALKAFAICLLLPMIPIVCIIGKHTEAAFAILGTIAGYILSKNPSETRGSTKHKKKIEDEKKIDA